MPRAPARQRGAASPEPPAQDTIGGPGCRGGAPGGGERWPFNGTRALVGGWRRRARRRVQGAFLSSERGNKSAPLSAACGDNGLVGNKDQMGSRNLPGPERARRSHRQPHAIAHLGNPLLRRPQLGARLDPSTGSTVHCGRGEAPKCPAGLLPTTPQALLIPPRGPWRRGRAWETRSKDGPGTCPRREGAAPPSAASAEAPDPRSIGRGVGLAGDARGAAWGDALGSNSEHHCLGPPRGPAALSEAPSRGAGQWAPRASHT